MSTVLVRHRASGAVQAIDSSKLPDWYGWGYEKVDDNADGLPDVLGVGSSTTEGRSRLARLMGETTPLAADPTFTLNTTVQQSPNKFVSAITAGPFRFGGADVGIQSSKWIGALAQTTSVNLGVRTVDNGNPFRVEFNFDGQAFEIDLNVTSNGPFLRVWANEQVSNGYTCSNAGGNGERYLKVDFGSRAPRRVVIEFELTSQFGGIYIAQTDSITAPSFMAARKLGSVGDSYAQGVGSCRLASQGTQVQSFYGYNPRLGRLLGYLDHRIYAAGGTGFIKTNAPAVNYQTRVQDVISYAPDDLIVQASINDATYVGLGQIGPAVTTYLSTIRAALPNTRIIVIGPLEVIGTPATSTVTINNEVAAAVAAFGGVPFIDAIAAGWITGTGKVGTTAGNGNADYYRSAGGHPSGDGHDFYARCLAPAIAALWSISL